MNVGMAPRRYTGRSSRQRRQRVFGGLKDDASGVLQSVANEVAPLVVDAIDINDVVRRVDIQEVVERVDLNVVLEGIDLDAVLAQADLNALLARLDLNGLIDQVDMDRIIDKVDINAIVGRVDLVSLVGRTDLGAIIAASGAGIAGKAVDVARSEGVGLDFLAQRWADRLLRRRPSTRSGGPAALIPENEPISP